jgi:Cu2+-exporting ATPase
MNAAAWAEPRLAAQVLRARRDGRSDVALRVAALDDPRRVLRLEQALRALPGVRRVAIDVAARRVRVTWDARLTPLPVLLDACARQRCAAEPLRRDRIDDARDREMRDALKRLLVAGMCAMQVMSYALVIYLGATESEDISTRGLFRWLGFLSAVPVVTYSALPFYRGAMRELRAHRLGIHLPVALAVLLVFLASAFATLRGRGEIYFDSISMFVFLLLAARYVELRAHHRSGALGEAAADAMPQLAQRRRADGALETVAALELAPGDRVHVPEGSVVPADGVLESARAELDESLLTGESRPQPRRRGERLLAGSLLLAGPAELRVEAGGDATAAARMEALGAHARAARPAATPEDRRAVARFVARVLLLTALTALGWLLVDPARAFGAAVAVLVVACPCAFALSRPAALASALGALSRHGVLVADGAALDALARVDTALFDKTGTLGVPTLDRGRTRTPRGDAPDAMLRLAAALARESAHPLARALADAARDDDASLRAWRVQAGPGGIEGEVAGRRLRLGRAGYALALAGTPDPDAADGALWLADAHGALAVFHFDERPRADAARTLAVLRADGVAAAIASGDAAGRVAGLAARLDIGDWHARQSPADKLERLRELRARGRTVLMVGDGGNDAPVLAGADVSAALAGGAELARVHADLLLLDGRLDGLVRARAAARRMRRVVDGSRHGALAYNLCAIPFAALGLVPPWLAGIGMSLSSLAVVLNALRAGREARA